MAAPAVGPCLPWVTWSEVAACCTPPDDLSDAAKAARIAEATELLWLLTGRLFDTCPDTYRPCVPCTCHTNPCGCRRRAVLELANLPVVSVESVTIDGVVLDPASYRVDDWRELVRVDGEGWPRSVNVDVANTEPGAFEIAYTYGFPPPRLLKSAAALYACELAKRCANLACAIPDKVRVIQRDGVSFEIVQPLDYMKLGLTGVPAVDAYIEAWRHAGRPGGVFDPAARPTGVRAGT